MLELAGFGLADCAYWNCASGTVLSRIVLSGIVYWNCVLTLGLLIKFCGIVLTNCILELFTRIVTGIVTGIVLEFCTIIVTAIERTTMCSCASEKHCNPTVL